MLLIPAVVSLLYKEKTGSLFSCSGGGIICLFILDWEGKRPENKQIYGKEGFVIVGLAWILWSLFGALPFFLSDCIPNYIDAVFVNGFRFYDDRIYYFVRI